MVGMLTAIVSVRTAKPRLSSHRIAQQRRTIARIVNSETPSKLSHSRGNVLRRINGGAVHRNGNAEDGIDRGSRFRTYRGTRDRSQDSRSKEFLDRPNN